MCLGCLVGFCTVSLTVGTGQIIAWIANWRRSVAMRAVSLEER